MMFDDSAVHRRQPLFTLLLNDDEADYGPAPGTSAPEELSVVDVWQAQFAALLLEESDRSRTSWDSWDVSINVDDDPPQPPVLDKQLGSTFIRSFAAVGLSLNDVLRRVGMLKPREHIAITCASSGRPLMEVQPADIGRVHLVLLPSRRYSTVDIRTLGRIVDRLTCVPGARYTLFHCARRAASCVLHDLSSDAFVRGDHVYFRGCKGISYRLWVKDVMVPIGACDAAAASGAPYAMAVLDDGEVRARLGDTEVVALYLMGVIHT